MKPLWEPFEFGANLRGGIIATLAFVVPRFRRWLIEWNHAWWMVYNRKGDIFGATTCKLCAEGFSRMNKGYVRVLAREKTIRRLSKVYEARYEPVPHSPHA